MYCTDIRLTQKAAADMIQAQAASKGNYVANIFPKCKVNRTDNEPRPLSSYTQILKANYICKKNDTKISLIGFLTPIGHPTSRSPVSKRSYHPAALQIS